MASFSFQPSGKIQLPSQEELEQADETTAILAYTSGTMDDGRAYWAYIAVKPSLYRKFYEVSAAGQSRALGDYGTILAGGFASEPPPEVIAEMQEKYGCDLHYEDKLEQEMRQEQDEFVDRQESKRIMDIVTMLKKQT